MNPSISTRNLLGGLCGGFAGILLAWYLNLAFMPVGVLFGVVTGWWHAEVVDMLKNAHIRAKATSTNLADTVGEFTLFIGQSIGIPRWITGMFRWIIAKAIIGSFVAVTTAPSKLYRFVREHPTNLTRAMQLIVGFGLTIALAVAAYKVPLSYGAKSSDTPLFTMLATLFGLTASIIYQRPEVSELSEMRIYYREWEILSHYGTVGLFCYLVAMYIRHLVGILLFVAIIICFCFPGMMIGFLAMYPIALILSIPWGIFQLMKRTGHWLCFGVTLTTTFTSWLIWQSSFENPLILWSVGLLTGVVSGFLTELVRRPLSQFFEGTKAGQWLSKEPWDHIVGGEDGYSEILFQQVLGFVFQDHKVARILRVICFGKAFRAVS